jgi:3-oxoacyl-[acyl-carrier protein] reductase
LKNAQTIESKGSVALVTGVGRPAGIGAAVCRELATLGHDIAFTYWGRYDDEMYPGDRGGFQAKFVAEIEAMGKRCYYREADLSDPLVPKQLVTGVVQTLGPIAILVNNAAYSTRADALEVTAEDLDAHYFVNFRATVLLSQAFLAQWSGETGGRIINLTSGQGLGSMPTEIAYAGSKGAIEAFTTSSAPTLGPLGVTINAVNPGPTDSGWMSDELRDELVPKFALGRIGRPEDAANLIAFLCSSQAGWITGQVINSEGGFERS